MINSDRKSSIYEKYIYIYVAFRNYYRLSFQFFRNLDFEICLTYLVLKQMLRLFLYYLTLKIFNRKFNKIFN